MEKAKVQLILILELGKIRIAQLVTLSTATGYILASGRLSWGILAPVVGVFLLALGSGALNQYQERNRDVLMNRTKNRPIPSGRISPKFALVIAIFLISMGTILLYLLTNLMAVLLGVLTVFWYNVIYTNLKRISPMAVVPGSVIGSLPPLLGWASTGQTIFSAKPLALALFFFIWQIPHFWLLLLNFGGDYEKAGYPSLTTVFDKSQLGRLTFIWIVATAAAIILMPLFGLGNSLIIFVLLFVASVLLIWKSTSLLKISNADFSFQLAFKGINIFILTVMFLLALDRLIQI